MDAIKTAAAMCFYHPREGWFVAPVALDALRAALRTGHDGGGT